LSVASVDIAIRLELPQGLCLGVAVPEVVTPALLERLHPEEARHLAGLPAARQVTFAAGRLALHAALHELGLPDAPVLPDARGAPRLPAGALGSISHKRGYAVALAAPSSPEGWAIGVDLEEDRPPRIDISRRVLTDEELATLDALPDPERGRQVIRRFSLKEAFYKAVSGFVNRRVFFHEVAVEAVREGGPAALTPRLRDGFRCQVQAGLYLAAGHIVAVARVRRG
jgi:phosphopantetheine--protein transferase-like protein